MNIKGFIIERLGNRNVVLQGIGKLFYQNGFPVSMAIKEFSNAGIEVSLLHVADECLKNGWSADTTITKLTDDFNDGGMVIDKELLTVFCNSSYGEQRDIIFKSLFINEPTN